MAVLDNANAKFDTVIADYTRIKMSKPICAHNGCTKKLALTSITCKCEKTFCTLHRYPTDHDCKFDFHLSAKEILLKTMSTPIIAEKFEKI